MCYVSLSNSLHPILWIAAGALSSFLLENYLTPENSGGLPQFPIVSYLPQLPKKYCSHGPSQTNQNLLEFYMITGRKALFHGSVDTSRSHVNHHRHPLVPSWRKPSAVGENEPVLNKNQSRDGRQTGTGEEPVPALESLGGLG